MKTLTPQILAMYLGSWCEVSGCDEIAEVNGYYDGKWALDFHLMYYTVTKSCSTKLHLRKLSSMTEEEAIVSKFADYDYRGVIVYYDPMFPDSEQFSPDQFTYLLSRSFDLFNLIEDGLAIDRDSLTNDK